MVRGQHLHLRVGPHHHGLLLLLTGRCRTTRAQVLLPGSHLGVTDRLIARCREERSAEGRSDREPSGPEGPHRSPPASRRSRTQPRPIPLTRSRGGDKSGSAAGGSGGRVGPQTGRRRTRAGELLRAHLRLRTEPTEQPLRRAARITPHAPPPPRGFRPTHWARRQRLRPLAPRPPAAANGLRRRAASQERPQQRPQEAPNQWGGGSGRCPMGAALPPGPAPPRRAARRGPDVLGSAALPAQRSPAPLCPS